MHWFSFVGIALVAAVFGGNLALGHWRRLRPVAVAGTWDCGYARPAPSMQYTGSSFGQMLAALFGWMLLPVRTLAGLAGLFPRRSRFKTEIPDTALDRAMLPSFSLAERVISWARPIQRGPVQVYVLYVLTALLLLLLFAGWTK